MEESRNRQELRLVVQHNPDQSPLRPFELFSLKKFEDLLEAFNAISQQQVQIFISDISKSDLRSVAKNALLEDSDIMFNEGFCLELGWNYFKLFDMMENLKKKIETVEQELHDCSYNPPCEVGPLKLRLSWFEASKYLEYKLTAIKRLHHAYLAEINAKCETEHSDQFPGLSLITQSHSAWIDNFESFLASRKKSIDRYEAIIQMSSRLKSAIEDAQPKYIEIDEFTTEFIAHKAFLPGCWYEITTEGIEKDPHHYPDLSSIITWLDRKVQTVIPTFTIKQDKYKTPASAKDALKSRLRRLFVDSNVEVSPLDEFVNSNFRMEHQSTVTKRHYTFNITKEENVKEFTEKLLRIFGEFVVEKNKADKLFWLHVHMGKTVSYKTLVDYVYRGTTESD